MRRGLDQSFSRRKITRSVSRGKTRSLSRGFSRKKAVEENDMNIFCSDGLVSRDFILNKIDTVQKNRKIIYLEIEDLTISREHNCLLSHVKSLLTAGDRVWESIKFVDTFQPEDFLCWQRKKQELMKEYENYKYREVVLFRANVEIKDGSTKSSVTRFLECLMQDEDVQRLSYGGALFGTSHERVPEVLDTLFDKDFILKEMAVVCVDCGFPTSSEKHDFNVFQALTSSIKKLKGFEEELLAPISKTFGGIGQGIGKVHNKTLSTLERVQNNTREIGNTTMKGIGKVHTNTLSTLERVQNTTLSTLQSVQSNTRSTLERGINNTMSTIGKVQDSMVTMRRTSRRQPILMKGGLGLPSISQQRRPLPLLNFRSSTSESGSMDLSSSGDDHAEPAATIEPNRGVRRTQSLGTEKQPALALPALPRFSTRRQPPRCCPKNDDMDMETKPTKRPSRQLSPRNKEPKRPSRQLSPRAKESLLDAEASDKDTKLDEEFGEALFKDSDERKVPERRKPPVRTKSMGSTPRSRARSPARFKRTGSLDPNVPLPILKPKRPSRMLSPIPRPSQLSARPKIPDKDDQSLAVLESEEFESSEELELESKTEGLGEANPFKTLVDSSLEPGDSDNDSDGLETATTCSVSSQRESRGRSPNRRTPLRSYSLDARDVKRSTTLSSGKIRSSSLKAKKERKDELSSKSLHCCPSSEILYAPDYDWTKPRDSFRYDWPNQSYVSGTVPTAA